MSERDKVDWLDILAAAGLTFTVAGLFPVLVAALTGWNAWGYTGLYMIGPGILLCVTSLVLRLWRDILHP